MILPPDQLAHSDTSHLLPDGNDVGLPQVCREGGVPDGWGRKKREEEGGKAFSLVLFLSSLVCYPFLAEKARAGVFWFARPAPIPHNAVPVSYRN